MARWKQTCKIFGAVLEVPVGIEVETDQYCNDLGIGHHALATAFWCVRSGLECIFCHLGLKFFAEIVCNTKYFSNFTFGNHDIQFIVWYL